MWNLILLFLGACDVLPICGHLCKGLVSSGIFTPPTLFDVAFSLQRAVGDLFCQSSDGFRS